MIHYDPRCMDIGCFNQVLHNACSAGRFREPQHASQTGRGPLMMRGKKLHMRSTIA